MTANLISRRKLIFSSIAVVVLVALIAMFFDRVLLREGVTRFDVLAISNLLTGLACGSLFYTLGRHEKERRERIDQRLHLIAEMNHHIRNALQVITFSVFDPKGREVSMDKIRQAVERIQWALREVLPKYSETSDSTDFRLLPDSLEKPGTSNLPALDGSGGMEATGVSVHEERERRVV